jgi:hypothetical protein
VKASLDSSQSTQSGNRILTGIYGPYRDNDALKAIIFAWLILGIMSAIFPLAMRQIVPAEILSDPNHKLTIVLRAVTIAGMASYIFCLPFYCFWVNRSCKNAWLLNPPKMRTSPGLAVGYYFIPVISLWKPYVSMCEIRNASFGMRDQLTTLLPLWWFAWVAYLLMTAGRISGRFSSNEEVVSISNKLATVADITGIALSYMTIALVISMTNAQKKRASEWRP